MKSFRKTMSAVLMAGALTAALAQSGGTAGPNPVPGGPIRMNSVGFLPLHNKTASLVAAGPTAFAIKNAETGETVFSGTSGARVTSSDTPDGISVANFTEFNTPGTYYLEALNTRSPEFVIGADAFNNAFKTMMLGMYLWRCGMPNGVSATHNGAMYSHAACHRADGNLSRANSGMSGTTKDATGGWHDAGDYNKYVVNSGVTVGLMLKAWEDHGEVLGKIDLHAPQDGNIPKYLSEVKWNLDWVAKMQFDNGWVSHKLTAQGFCGYIMPNEETDTRYFMPRSSAATGAFAAMLAQASRIYRPYDAALADKWLEQAERAFKVWADTNFRYVAADPSTSPTMSTTGAYQVSQANDSTFRFWAAAELWETTGKNEYLQAFESIAGPRGSGVNASYRPNVASDLGWSDVGVLAGITYATSQRPGKNNAINTALRDNIISAANSRANNTGSHNYGRPFGTGSYYWGNHGALTANAYLLNAAAKLADGPAVFPGPFRNAGHEILGHILGRNYFGRSFVTGVGHNPPVNTHCRRSIAYYAANRQQPQWPGYIIGGPHSGNLTDPNSNPPGAAIAPPNASCPTAGVCYFDDYRDYARNEIAINWNGSMIYALSGFVVAESGTGITGRSVTQKQAAPKAKTARMIQVKGGKTSIDIPPGAKIYGLDGRLVAQRKIGDAKAPVIRRNGVFIMRVDGK